MTLGRDMERLRRVPFFACFGEDALHLLAFSIETRTLDAGEVVFRRGETADGAVLLVRGALVLDPGQEAGCGLERIAAGQLVGEAALLAPGIRTTTATADGPIVIVTVARSLVLRVLEAYPDNARALHRYWAGRLRGDIQAIKAEARS